MRQINEAGIKLVKHYEGFRSNSYICSGGKLTIGYGHVILPHENHLKSARLTIDEATDILRNDLAIAESHVIRYVKVDLNDNQFAALVSFTFNLGGGNLKSSTLLRKLNEGDYKRVPSELNKWVNAGGKKLKGLVRRRAEEGKLFETDVEQKCCCPCHD